MFLANFADGNRSEEDAMTALLHFKTHDQRYFHTHPLQGTFSLMTTMVLALFMVLLLVMSAR